MDNIWEVFDFPLSEVLSLDFKEKSQASESLQIWLKIDPNVVNGRQTKGLDILIGTDL